MKIMSINEDQLNKIFDRLGSIILETLDPEKKLKAVLLHQENINILVSSSIPDLYKHMIGMMVQQMNFNGYHVTQIVKSEN